MWCAAWNTIVNTDDGYAKINVSENLYNNGYKYKGISEEDAWLSMNGTTSPLDDTKLSNLEKDDTYSLFFPHTTTPFTAYGITGTCWGYFLASPSEVVENGSPVTTYLMAVNIDGVACSIYGAWNHGIRPVVSLTTDIRLTDSGESLKGKPVYDIVQ